MPFAAASVLKSSSQAWKLPVPQGAAAAEVAGIATIALNTSSHRRIIEIGTESLRSSRARRVAVLRATAAKKRLLARQRARRRAAHAQPSVHHRPAAGSRRYLK